MQQSHLIRPVSFQASPLSQPPPRRVYTPTPDGFERFLRDCLVHSPTAVEVMRELSS